MLDMLLADDVVAWELGPDATWRRRSGDLVDVQRRFAETFAGGRRSAPIR